MSMASEIRADYGVSIALRVAYALSITAEFEVILCAVVSVDSASGLLCLAHRREESLADYTIL